MPAQTPRKHGLFLASGNHRGRDFVVGDLHGQYDLLIHELECAGFQYDRDRLFCAGDLVDRGEQSMECLRLLAEPWFFSVLGNHEDLMLSALLEDDASAAGTWFANGGLWIHEYDKRDIVAFVQQWMVEMPLAIEIPCGNRKIGLVHAAVSSGQWGCFDLDADIWNRRVARDRHDPNATLFDVQVRGIDAVVVGHNVTPAPMVRGNTLFMDTGAAAGLPPTVWPIEAVFDVVDRHVATSAAQTFFYALSRDVAGHSLNEL